MLEQPLLRGRIGEAARPSRCNGCLGLPTEAAQQFGPGGVQPEVVVETARGLAARSPVNSPVLTG
ncbi:MULTISPECIES: hypothetical protein [unclassified Cryobacterium]|uniref:hypothetical protein n=1 Tax=unclassified Cryobacterium TaxID=2649013 RepID=UPI00106AE3CE|nr:MULTISPECIES: hypothetical protein [unclassified Cryobacterium]TFD09875.1 hypothetical protein E3T29_02210 [Cryobacterium sp. TMT1-66-1]TFD14262.1 hypothetical protein E3T35_02380 [Cryobacterium sp. TMT1-2-2]